MESYNNEYYKIYKFPNGYCVTVRCQEASYGGKEGLFEVSILDHEGKTCYNTPFAKEFITQFGSDGSHNVIGWLDFHGVDQVLEKIKNLPNIAVNHEKIQ